MADIKRVHDMIDDFDKNDGHEYGDNIVENEDDDEVSEDEDEDGDASQDDTGDSDEGDDSDSDEQAQGQREQTQNTQQRNQAPDIRPLPNGTFQDRNGNLTDQHGKIIARAGSERRLFERNVRMDAALRESGTRIQQMEQQLSQMKVLNGEPARLGLDLEDLTLGMRIMGEFKKNPVEAARSVLELVMGQGHNLSDILGNNAKDAIEMRAISRMIDERTAPLRTMEQSTNRQRQEAELRQTAEREIQKFVDGHENASVHLDVIDNLIGKRPNLTPESAYYELKLFAQQNGLDFTKPLAPQVQSPQANASRGNRREQTRNVRPMPNGMNGSRSRPMAEVEPVEAKTSWDDIINSSLRNNGFRGR